MPPFSLITNFFKPFTEEEEDPRAIPARATQDIRVSDAPTSSLSEPPSIVEDPRVYTRTVNFAPNPALHPRRDIDSPSSSGLSSLPSELPTPRPSRTTNLLLNNGIHKDEPASFSAGVEAEDGSNARNDSLSTNARPAASNMSLPPRSTQVVNSSFSSTSSRRVVQGSMKAVTDSDSDGFSDSDDDLIDLDVLFARKRRKVSPPTGSLSKAFVVQGRSSQGGSAASARARKTDLDHSRKPVYKNSLQSMVKQHQAEQASEDRIRESEALLAAAEDRAAERAARQLATDEVLSDDEDKQRIKAAIDRIEMAEDEQPFHFFHEVDSTPSSSPDFPLASLPEKLQSMCTGSQRNNFFTSGFAADIARTAGLSDDLLVWIHDQLLYEIRPRLCEAYLFVLESVPPARLSLAIRNVSAIRSRYAGSTCFNTKTEIRSVAQLPANLKYVLRALRICLSAETSLETSVSTLIDLILLNADQQVTKLPELCQEIEYTFATLLDQQREPNLTQLFPLTITQILASTILTQHQLYCAIAKLPASTVGLHKFRRLLALHCVLAADATDLVDPASADTETRLLVTLKRDERFAVRKNTNWATFEMLINVLDIAIDNGFSDFSFLPSHDSPNAQKQSVLDSASKRSTGEQLFNKRIDDMCKRLRIMLNNIKDGGTTHLRRTEARNTLERLCIRMETCVRTRTKTHATVFGGSSGAAQRGMLEKFLHKGDGRPASVVQNGHASDGSVSKDRSAADAPGGVSEDTDKASL